MNATIAQLAYRYGMEPHELHALADMHDIASHTPLTGTEEAFLVDLLERTDELGVYR